MLEERKEDMSQVLLTIPEVARLFRVHPSTVRKWIQEGTIEGVLLPHKGKGSIYRIPWVAVNHLLTENNTAPDSRQNHTSQRVIPKEQS